MATAAPGDDSHRASANFLRSSYGAMAFIRALESKVLALSQTQPPAVLGSMHLCAGQEAVAVGAVAGLRDDDQIIATYRGHGWALAAGLPPLAVMAEICQKAEGINGGRGGSAYFMAPDTRFVGENSIVGAGTTIACGVALANLAASNGRVVLVAIGDGAMNQGAVHEAMAFAAARALPVVFVVENNGWSELTATGDVFRVNRLAQRAGGYGIPSATVDGTDPAKVRDTVAGAAAHARAGKGPSLLEFTVPRLWGHYNRDIEHYRSKADKRAAEERDPLKLSGERLTTEGGMSQAEVEALGAEQIAAVEALAARVIAMPAPDAAHARDHVSASPGSTRPRRDDRNGQIREMTYVEAVNAALRAELESDGRTVVYGEDVGKAGGIFGASRYLQRDFGAERVFDTPIAENAILGSAVGAAMAGLKPIVEIMWADFLFVAIDQLINQASNVRYVTGGKVSVPLVVRTQQGATPGSCAQHSQCVEAILAHVPGLKVALPSTPQDAYAVLRAAAADPDPCIVIEARGLYQTRGEVDPSVDRPVGTAKLRKAGKDAAIVTWGTMVGPSLAAAERLEAEGCDVAVLDLVWLSPLDEGALRQVSEAAGGNVLIVHEAVRTGGFGGEIASRIREFFPWNAPLNVDRLTTPDVRMPAAPSLQASLLPNADTITAAIRSLLARAVVARPPS